ncbi:trypsin-like serine peptidase [Roseibium sp.]|uniref:trypsin-like serine peptidase n=1 Tax=Roseibium sp. TaxID=1936156 RepID=UPI003A96CAAF
MAPTPRPTTVWGSLGLATALVCTAGASPAVANAARDREFPQKVDVSQRQNGANLIGKDLFNPAWPIRQLSGLPAPGPIAPATTQLAQDLPGMATSFSAKGAVIIDSEVHPWPSIGRVNRSGYSSTSMCTGTLIRPDVVLTAAHCLFDRVTGRAFTPDDVVFLAGVRREAYSESLPAKCFKVDPDYDPTITPQLQTLYNDVALIILADRSDLPLVQQVTAASAQEPPVGEQLVSVGYHRDRRFLPTADPSCKVIGAVEGSWVTDCLTKQGASGGPVFLRKGDDLQITAIMSAKAGDQASVVVPRYRWEPLLHQATCDGAPPAASSALPGTLAPQPLSSTAANPDPTFELRPALD